jgi:Homing endonuclease associated repeat
MPDKQHILNSIAAIARGFGRTPSLSEFVSLTGISKYRVLECFPSWNDAVRAAGLEPYRLYARLTDDELLEDWGEVVRKNRALPSRLAYLRMGKHESRTLEKRFGGWSSIPRAFCNFAKGKREWADVLALLPAPVPMQERGPKEKSVSSIPQNEGQHAQLEDRLTYGNPFDFRGLRHEPVNEQGVVLLFGMVAKELGFMVEAVQTGFRDCEAKRQIAPGRWQRVLLEFEYESRNFRDHGHPAKGCDVIVCWRHNWDECPEDIEVVELSSIIKSFC